MSGALGLPDGLDEVAPLRGQLGDGRRKRLALRLDGLALFRNLAQQLLPDIA